MLLSFLLILGVIAFILYKLLVKPLMTVNYLKKQFQLKGYKVYVEPLNFLKENVFPKFNTNFQKHGDSYYHYANKYQGYDLIILNSLTNVILLVANPDLLKDSYRQIQNLEKASFVKNNFNRMYGGGLLQSQGKQWRQKRKLYSQIFNFKLLQELHPCIDGVVEKTMENWDISSPIDLSVKMKNLLFKVFVFSYFGRDLDSYSYKNMTYSQSLVKLFDDMLKQSFSWKNIFFGVKFLQLGIFQKDKQIKQHLSVIKRETKAFVLKRYEQILNNKQKKQNSILQKIVFNQRFQILSQEQKDVKFQDIVGDILLFFFAGTDTTSAVLTTSFHLLAKHPEVREKIMKQLKQNGNICDASNSKKLKYIDATMNEVMRLYGPVNSLPRRQIKNNTTKIGDVVLPKGVILVLQSVTVQHSQKYFKNPNEFMPQRWFEQRNEHPFSFIVFGSGARNCIGQYLARMEYKIILSKFLTKFDFETDQKLHMKFTIIYESFYNKFTLERKKC